MKNSFLFLFVLFSCQPQNSAPIGVDFTGKERSCKPMPKDILCTMDFQPADQFALECRQRGDTAIQCGCHDWICVKK